jgi:hypothetical protein
MGVRHHLYTHGARLALPHHGHRSGFPNPTSGLLTIDLENIEEAVIVVRNIHGQLVLQETVKDTRNHQVQLEGASGLYTFEVKTSAGQSEVFRVVKK